MKIEIKDTAYGGFGVGRSPEGVAVFVPHTVDGDTVHITITEDKKSFLYAKLEEVITPSDLRAKPQCPYSNVCGGCLFGHISYPAQIKIKEKIIKNAFRKYPYELCDIEIVESPRTDYRLRATFRALNGKIGFFGFKSNDFVGVKKCIVVKESLFEKVKAFAEENSLNGEIYAIETDEGITLANIKCENTEIKSKDYLDGFTFNGFKSGLAYSAYNTGFGAVGIGHKTFFQANRFLLDEFQKKAADFAETALDITELYSGAGFFTTALQKKSSRVKACELDADAVNLAKHFDYPSIKADAGDFLDKIDETDTLFLDPSRDGISNKVIKNILRLRPRKIVYVSCNPMTLARDIVKIAGNYKIENMTMFDMFPETFHVECVCVLKRINE